MHVRNILIILTGNLGGGVASVVVGAIVVVGAAVVVGATVVAGAAVVTGPSSFTLTNKVRYGFVFAFRSAIWTLTLNCLDFVSGIQ